MAERIETLLYALCWRVLFKYFGMLGVVLAALNSVPLAVAVLFGELEVAGRYGVVLVALLALALPLARMKAPERLQVNEALVVVLVFVLGSLVMSYPLGAAGDSWLDGWFEAVSGITTTGLSTAVSTGGFSTFDDSLAGLGPGAAAVIMGFAWLGAVSLPLYTLAWQKGPGVMRRAPELCGR